MNKLIIVTGGTKGIGRAIVEKFAQSGFDVITCARNINDLNSLKLEIENIYKNTTLFPFQADLSMKSEVNRFTEFIHTIGRSVDVLVNNAGYFCAGEISNEPDGTLEEMMNANVYSAYYTTRGIVGKMKERKQGHIFNICSVASIKAYPTGGSYSTTKFALLGFSKSLREELKKYNIRVTAILPGATKTASWDGVNLPDERFISPNDIADTIYTSYSLSDRSVVEEIIIRPQLGDI